MSDFLKIVLQRDMAAGDYLSEAPSPPRFLFGMVKQFVGWDLVKYTVFNSCISSPHNPIPSHLPSPPVTHCINTYPFTYSEGGRVGGEPVRG
jgi:hypothetical protein